MNVEIVGSGSPLVVLHGFTGAASNWQPFFKSWGQHFEVIAPDLIGHGKTDAPTDAERYTMDQGAKDLADLLSHLGVKRAHVLGYSMGGRLALTFAVRYPDCTSSLILESSSPGLMTEQERQDRIERDEKLADRIEQYGVEAFVNEWEKLPLFSTQTKEVRERLRMQRLDNSACGLANSLRGMGTGAQTPLWGELDTLKIPVRLVVGERDRKFCNIAEDMGRRLPNAEIVKAQHAGHAVHVEQSRFFGKMVVEFFSTIERNERIGNS
jgi:2-succinyl-6-hydroxy-2,4-cyclohexadiene-1-carboxylate synthase